MKKFIFSLLAILATLLAGTWLSFPAIIQALEPRLARELGLEELRVITARPGWHALNIREIEVAAGPVRLQAREIAVGYRWRELLQGHVQSLEVDELHIRLQPSPSEPEPAPFTLPRLPFTLAALPLDSARVSDMKISAPHLDLEGQGNLEFAQARLSVSASAHTPLIARPLNFELSLQTPADGAEVLLELTLLEAGNTPWVTARAIERAGALDITGNYRLQDFALDRLAGLTGMPPGQGLLEGTLTGRLGFDAARNLDWSSLQAEGPLRLRWDSLDRSLLIDAFDADLQFRDGELLARIGADITAVVQDTQVRLRATEGVLLRADQQQVILAPGLQLDVRSGEVALQVQLQQLEVPLGDIPTASLNGEIELLSPQIAAGTIKAALRAPDGLPSHSAEFSFNGTFQLDTRMLPLGLSGSYLFAPDAMTAELALTSGPVQRMPVQLRYPLDGSAATAQAAHSFTWSEPLIAALMPGWDADYDLDRGEMDLTVELALADAMTGTGTVQVRDSTLRYGDYLGKDSAGQVDLTLTRDGIEFRKSMLRIGSLDVGFPVTAIEGTFSGNLATVHLEQFQARLLGGQATAKPFDFGVDPAQADIGLTLTDLDLGAVLALEGEDISGGGRLDGFLPVRIRNGEISVNEGRVDARPPGGSIHLAPSLANAIAQPGLDIALRALQDFRYTTLSAGVNYAETGDLNLSLRLEGHNPAVEKGRPIHYNLNISENIPTLLESLRLSDSFTDSIQKRVIR